MVAEFQQKVIYKSRQKAVPGSWANVCWSLLEIHKTTFKYINWTLIFSSLKAAHQDKTWTTKNVKAQEMALRTQGTWFPCDPWWYFSSASSSLENTTLASETILEDLSLINRFFLCGTRNSTWYHPLAKISLRLTRPVVNWASYLFLLGFCFIKVQQIAIVEVIKWIKYERMLKAMPGTLVGAQQMAGPFWFTTSPAYSGNSLALLNSFIHSFYHYPFI